MQGLFRILGLYAYISFKFTLKSTDPSTHPYIIHSKLHLLHV